MALMEVEWHPNGRQLRVFGISGLVASVVAALILHFIWAAAILWVVIVLAAGMAILLCSLISPAATRVLYVGLTLVAMPIGFVVSFLLLGAFYFLLLTPLYRSLPYIEDLSLSAADDGAVGPSGTAAGVPSLDSPWAAFVGGEPGSA